MLQVSVAGWCHSTTTTTSRYVQDFKTSFFSLLQVLLYDYVVGYIIHISHILVGKRKHEYRLYFDIENWMLAVLSFMHRFRVMLSLKPVNKQSYVYDKLF